MSTQICDEPSQFTEGERPRPQGSSPVEEFPETGKYTDSDKEVQNTILHGHNRDKPGTETIHQRTGLQSLFLTHMQ